MNVSIFYRPTFFCSGFADRKMLGGKINPRAQKISKDQNFRDMLPPIPSTLSMGASSIC